MGTYYIRIDASDEDRDDIVKRLVESGYKILHVGELGVYVEVEDLRVDVLADDLGSDLEGVSWISRVRGRGAAAVAGGEKGRSMRTYYIRIDAGTCRSPNDIVKRLVELGYEVLHVGELGVYVKVKDQLRVDVLADDLGSDIEGVSWIRRVRARVEDYETDESFVQFRLRLTVTVAKPEDFDHPQIAQFLGAAQGGEWPEVERLDSTTLRTGVMVVEWNDVDLLVEEEVLAIQNLVPGSRVSVSFEN